MKAADFLDEAIELAKTQYGMTGEFVKSGHIARADVDLKTTGPFASIIEEAEYVITGGVDRYAERDGKNKVDFTFGIHWTIKDRSRKDTKAMHHRSIRDGVWGEWDC